MKSSMEYISRECSLPHDGTHQHRHRHRIHSRAKPRIIYFLFIRNYLNVEYTSCHRKILFDLSFEKGIGRQRGEAIIIGGTFRARTFSDERAPRRRRICTWALSISSECPWGPDDHRPARRRDEWIIETSSRTDERLLQIFVQLLAVPSLIAHRTAAAGGFLGVSLPALLSASLLVIVLLLDGSIANVDRLVIGRVSVRLRAESKKRFSGWRKRERRLQ